MQTNIQTNKKLISPQEFDVYMSTIGNKKILKEWLKQIEDEDGRKNSKNNKRKTDFKKRANQKAEIV